MFADGGARFSAGYYDAAGIGQSRIAGNIVQAHVSIGAQSQTDRLSWRAGLGAFNVAYSGGSSGASTPNSAQILAPSASISYVLSPQWNLGAAASQSFRLPSLLEEYGYGADTSAIYFDRYGTQDVEVSYSDLQRVRVTVFAMNTNVTLLDNGTISSVGASLGWQISPELSLRAWAMHFDDTSQPYAPIFRFGARPQPATPASAWLTFENPHGFRADAIWRQDLIDYRADSHVDGSIGAPLAGDLRWFIGTERRLGARYVSVGLRFSK
jgi:outer membrane receptor protein involved in Fe transport